MRKAELQWETHKAGKPLGIFPVGDEIHFYLGSGGRGERGFLEWISHKS